MATGNNAAVSRRSFVGGAALAGTAAVLAGHAGVARADSDPASSAGADAAGVEGPASSAGAISVDELGAQHWSFMDAPAPIPDDEIAETYDCEVLVIGAGISGVPAVAYASSLGADVLCLEKLGHIVTTRPTGMSLFGTSKLKELGVLCTDEEKATIVRDIFGGSNATSKQDIVKLWLDESGEVGDFLIDIIEQAGVPVKVGGYYGYYKHLGSVAESQEDMKQTGGVYSDSYWNMYALQHQFGESEEPGVCLWGRDDFSDADWLGPLYNYSVEHGARYMFETPAVQLVREEGWEDDDSKRVIGCIAQNADGAYIKVNASKGVLLATGGFDWDDEMVRCYYPIGLRTARTWQTWMTGDGHKMGMWVGAKMEDPGQYNSHMMGCTAPAMVMRIEDVDKKRVEDEFTAFIKPWKEWNLPSNAMGTGLKVNQRGERFTNEEIGYFMSGPIIDKQPEGLFWAIWDGASQEKNLEHYFDRLVDGIDTSEHSELMIEQGMLLKADTIDELIEKMNGPAWDNGKFDGETFKKTLAHYNDMCAAGEDTDFYKPAMFMSTVDTPPFYAAEMGSSWMTTLGGLEIDSSLHVLDGERQPIPGLYAGGNPAGCFYGQIYAPQVPMSLSGHSATLSCVAVRNMVNGE
ncbi:MAG: FAD-binding protein [Coriobacteriia bacterium]|nr:FAD-binding protein [Coriobacteriia bacterium]